MADHSKPTNSSLYTDYTTELDARFDDLAVGLDPAVTTATNIPTNTIRWNSVNSYWEKYNGSTWDALDTGYEIDLAGARKITTNSASPALTITQTGAGNAFVVEDSASPDSTPFVIDSAGRVIAGYTSAVNNWNGAPDSIALHALSANALPSVGLYNWSTTTSRNGTLNFNKSVSGIIGTNGAVANAQSLGRIVFAGDDGTAFIPAVEISASVDGTPGTNDMPGRLMFSTTADGASTPTERMRIDSAGDVGIGVTAPAAKLDVLANTSEPAVRITQTGAGNAFVVEDSASTDATPFVIDNAGNVVIGYTSSQTALNSAQLQANTLGNGASYATANWNSAASSTPRYATFKSVSGAIGTFTGNLPINTRLMDLSAQGDNGTGFSEAARIRVETDTASSGAVMPSRFTFALQDSAGTLTERMRIDSAGQIGIGVTTVAGNSVRIGKNVTGSTSAMSLVNRPTIQPDVTGATAMYDSLPATSANGGTPYTVSFLTHYTANQGTFNADSTVTNQRGFAAGSAIIGATNNYGFYGDIPSGTGRWNFYANGTAANAFNGNTRFGGVTAPTVAVDVTGAVKATGNIAGGYVAHAAGTTAMAFGSYNVVRVTPNADATYTSTVPAAGSIVVLSILTSGTTSYTITFGTGFKSTGTLATGTVSARYFNLTFVSDGTNLIETARTVAIA